MKLLVLRCWWLSLLALTLTACFSPSFQDGKIACGPNDECPPGLECVSGLCRSSDEPIVDAPTNSRVLTVTPAGNGNGVITSNPAGINCGSDCTESMPVGSSVTLTASAATGSMFVGWSGACTGTSTCIVTLDADTMVTANFALQNTLMVTLAGNGSGIVSSNPPGISCGSDCSEQYAPNTMVTLTASAATGSEFDGWSGGAGCTGIGTCTVTLDAAKMVTATFSLQQHVLTVAPAGTGFGTVSSTPGGINCGTDCTEAFNYNAMVTLSASATTGSSFTGWSGTGITCPGTGSCTVTITQATTVTATFALTTHAVTVMKLGNGAGSVASAPTGIDCPTDCTESFNYGSSVTLSATAGAGSTFTGWGAPCSGTSTCVVDVTAATTVNATFTLNQYSLSVTKTGNGTALGTVASDVAGISCGSDCAELYNYNTTVVLTATTQTGATFTGWTDTLCAASGTGPCNVRVDQVRSVTANFALVQHALTVSTNGTGSGTISGTGISCTTAGGDCTESYDFNTMVTLSASADNGSTFTGWGLPCSGTGNCVVTMTQAQSVQATFSGNSYAITISKGASTGTGKVVSTSPAGGIDCGTDCVESYGFNQALTLTATADPGSQFTSWSGGGCSGANPVCNTTVTAAATVTANFTITTRALNVATNGGNGSGSVTSDLLGINCPGDCTEAYVYGTVVTLTAAASTGSSFTGWSGTGISCPGTGTCEVTMDQVQNVTAAFTLGSAALTVTTGGNGAGAVVSSDLPPGISCGEGTLNDCTEDYTNGTMVTLTATATTGSNFTGWTGTVCHGSISPTCSFTIVTGTAVNVTANFTLTTHALTVTKAGLGSGTVTSSPSGIDCPTDCTENYNYEETVTLTANPAANATFTGWSNGPASCNGTTGACVVTITAATSVTATFDIVQHSVFVSRSGKGEGLVTSMPTGINCGDDCDESYADGTILVLTAAPAAGSTFVQWTDSLSACGTTPMCTVTVREGITIDAEFALATFALNVSDMPAGKNYIESTDGAIQCGDGFTACSSIYNYDTVVELIARALDGYTFVGWTGGGCESAGTGNCIVTMTQVQNVTANFEEIRHALDVVKGGTGAANGTVTSSPGGISCGSDCTESYPQGSVVTLTATVTSGTGTSFSGWSNCDLQAGTSCQMTMDKAKSVTANFTVATYTLGVTKSGTGAGGVTSNPSGINCTAAQTTCTQATFSHGTSITLTAAPASGSTFGSWAAIGPCSGVTSQMCTFSITANTNVGVSFNAIAANKMFVTNAAYVPRSLGGITGADDKCQAIATGKGLGGTWKAFLSSTQVNASTRLGSASGWVRLDTYSGSSQNRRFANTPQDLFNGRLYSPPRINESGVDIGSVPILTATNSLGQFQTSYGDCGLYDNATATGFAGAGQSPSNGFHAITYQGTACDQQLAHLMCLQVDNNAANSPLVLPPAPGNFRRVFQRSWTPSGGVTAADNACATDANTAGFTGTYKALLATTTQTPMQRMNTTSAVNWARMDGVPILASVGLWSTSTYFDTAPNMTLGLGYTNSGAWLGSTSLTTTGTTATTCNNWMGGTGTTGSYGLSSWTHLGTFASYGNALCTQNYVITCVQQ